MRAVTDEFPERVLIGEIYMPVEDLVHYYGPQLNEVHLPFNFNLVTLRDWNAATVRAVVERYEAALPAGAWPNWVLGNHDQPRFASRRGLPQARLAQMLLLTLRGTPTMYYGDEIGMEDVPIPPERVVDPQGIRTPGFGRDPERTPMQWDGGPGAGFTTGDPWLPLAADYAERNVAAQREDAGSLLSLTRHLLELRRATPALSVGAYATVEAEVHQVYAYLRELGAERMLVALNFGDQPATLDLAAVGVSGRVVACTHMDSAVPVALAALKLRPYEGLVVVVDRA
jgi:alpha-glucosidase